MLRMLSWITNFLCPPTKTPTYQQAESCFTKEELEAIHKEHCVHVLSQYTQTVDDQRFVQWAGLAHAAPALREGLCNAVRRLSGEAATTITLDGIVVAKAHAETMDRLTAADFAFMVMDIDSQGSVSKEHLTAVVAGCLILAQNRAAVHDDASQPAADHTAAAAAIAEGACSYTGEGAAALTRDAYSKLCKVCPALNASLVSLLCNIGNSTCPKPQTPNPTAAPQPAKTPTAVTPASSTSRLLGTAAAAAAAPASSALHSPAVVGSKGSLKGSGTLQTHGGSGANSSCQAGLSGARLTGVGSGSAAAAAAAAVTVCPGRVLMPVLGWGLCSPQEGLMQHGWAWLLAAGLPPQLRQDWRLLFNSSKHGMSYSTFQGRVGESSPTLLLIRDKAGAVFGGIAHKPWEKTGTFYGDYASCIFSLHPKACIYPASGINANLQWCGVGFSQLPNGLGFGGQVGHFGLFVDATFDTGMSRPCATYASPCLASSQTFQVDSIEAWLLQPPAEEGNEAGTAYDGSKGAGLSALEKSKEDRKILEWAGVGSNFSAGVRDEPIEG